MPATVVNRLVQVGPSYPARPAMGTVDFLGSLDPGAALLPGDTWTQLPLVAPNAPTIGTATAGDAEVAVAYTPSATGTAADSYTATSTPGGIIGTGTTSPITIDGLTNTTAYTFTVHATNAAGSSAESAASSSVTPTAGTTKLTDTFTGTNGAAWSSTVWQSVLGAAASADIQSNQGHFLITSTSGFEDGSRRFTPSASANWRVRTHLVTPPTITGWLMQTFLQATSWTVGTQQPSTAYFINQDAAGFTIYLDVSGTLTTLNPTVSIAATNRWLDIKVVGGVLKYKTWTGIASQEPATYITVPNPSPLTGTGAAGIHWQAGATTGSYAWYFDNAVVDTNPVT